MATLAAGAPLLAGGPPGWVLYGLLAVGTLAVGAIVVSQASRDAAQTFPDTPPTSVQPCPQTTETPKEESQPRVDPVPIPKEQEDTRRHSCATEHPEIILCAALPPFYTYSSLQAAFRFLRARSRETLRLEKTRPAERGPCPATGNHTAVRAGGAYIASIVCCPCCTDTASGPVLSTKCGIV